MATEAYLFAAVRRTARSFSSYSIKYSFQLTILLALIVGHILLVPHAWSSQISIWSDENVDVIKKSSFTGHDGGPAALPQKIDSSHNSLDTGDGDQEDQVLKEKNEIRKLIGPSLENEDRLMRQSVHILDTESAYVWLSRFISTRPWNCPLHSQRAWIEAIMLALQRNQLPLCKELLGLVASIISIESGFHANPLAIDPSRDRSMENMLARAEEKLYQKYGSLLAIPPVAKLYGEYKDRYYAKLINCKTEWEIELVARNIAADLRSDTSKLPAIVRGVINRKIGKLTNVIRSKGSMQLKFSTARKVMKERGDNFSDDELLEYMYTINGGVDVGVAALKPAFIQYAAWNNHGPELSWLFFVGMDYNYGFFSSRNMMEQIRIRDLSGQNIGIDGDLLRRDKDGKLDIAGSETLIAAQEALPLIPKDKILKAFLLEKDPDYIYTDIHQIIAKRHREIFGDSPFAIIGRRSMGEGAEVKYGTTWTTDVYFQKLDRHLNSIPWDD
ncbi:MAG: DUF1615 family protein [Desulfomonilaceae bacterium]